VSSNKQQTKIDLYLKVEGGKRATTDDSSNDHFISDEIKLTNKNSTIFQYIQNLIFNDKKRATKILNTNQSATTMTNQFEKTKNIWDVNYSLIYRESSDNNDNKKEMESSGDNENEILNKDVEQVLKLLTILRQLISNIQQQNYIDNDSTTTNSFLSEKINNKLIQQLQDPLVLASRSLPAWCQHLLHFYEFIFPFETRQLYFTTTAFGVSRSIVWLQNKRDTLINNLRGPQSARLMRDDHEFRIGRLKHERIKIPREPADDLLKSAMNALRFHATRKAILEIEFNDEEGTGLGPTLEFFSLIAKQLQLKEFALWQCEDDLSSNEYVHNLNGLFPAAYPLPTDDSSPQYTAHYYKILDFFHFMGIFLAKSLQDQRLVDIPFSSSFLKTLCHTESVIKRDQLDATTSNSSKFSLESILDLNDLVCIDPHRGQLLQQLKRIATERQINIKNNNFDITDDIYKIEMNGIKVSIEDLGLVFVYNPPSRIYSYNSFNLKPDGEDCAVTIDNAGEYVDLIQNFILNKGIEKQLKAFIGKTKMITN
jgi:E3 ubiquitin-protein ligase HECTD1